MLSETGVWGQELEAQMTVRAGLNAHKTKEDAMKQRIAYQVPTPQLCRGYEWYER